MAGGHGAANDLQLKGIERYINSYTMKGRLYGAYSSIAIWAGIFLTAKLLTGKKSNAIEKK